MEELASLVGAVLHYKTGVKENPSLVGVVLGHKLDFPILG